MAGQSAGRSPVYRPGLVEPEADVDYTQVLADRDQRLTGPLTGLAVVIVGFFLVYPVVMGAVDGIGWLARGKPGTFQTYWTAATGFEFPEGMLAANLGLAALIGVSMLAVRFLHRRQSVWLSSVQPGVRWRFMLIVVVVAAIVLNTAYWLTEGRVDFHWNPSPNLWIWLVLIVLTAPLQAAGEEYFFRGYLMQVVGSVLRQKWVVVVLAGLAFAALHGTQNVPLLLSRIAFGVLMGALVVLTGGLEAAIAAHAVNNVLAFGYAAMSGGVAGARSLTEVTWTTAGINILAYAVIAAIAYVIGRAMRVATATP